MRHAPLIVFRPRNDSGRPAFADETAHAHAVATAAPGPEQLYEGLGNVHHPVTTNSPLAQKYFDQGLAFNYGFNHLTRPINHFAAAAALDPKMAMADWGVALVLGPNYNLPGNDERMKIAYSAIQRAQSLEKFSTPEEKRSSRLSRNVTAPTANKPQSANKPTRMRCARSRINIPNDPDVQVLFAESLMDLHPWQLWSADGNPGPQTLELVATLERTLKSILIILAQITTTSTRWRPRHIRSARSRAHRRLATMAPMQGHLVHMPAHIYMRTGKYHDSSNANEAAIRADQYFLAKSHETGVYLVMYAIHNIDFLLYSEMMEGRKHDSLNTAHDLKNAVPIEVVKAMPMAEVMWPKLYFAMARFGEWDEILAEPVPPREFPYTTAMWHYARGLAFAAKGKPGDAAKEREALDANAARIPAEFMVGPNNKADGRHQTRIADSRRRHRRRTRRS